MENSQNDKSDDRLLLQCICADDKKAFDKLFLKYYSTLYLYATSFVGEDDAKDIVQEIMFWIWDNRKNIVINSSLKNYLLCSVRNKCLNQIKIDNIHKYIFSIIAANTSIQYEDNNFIKELNDKINEAIKKLPQTYRDTFIKNRLKRKTYKEIADEECVSCKNIDYRMQKTLKLLRSELKEYL